MTRRRALRLSLAIVAGVVVLVLVVAVAAAAIVIRRPLPQTSGSLTLAGLSADATVTRDARGVPYITAATPEDLFRAQGYVQAQDRFFEMDYRRHVTAGRLSELVGANSDALAADKVIRTFGWRRVAEQELPLLAPTTRAYLQAYADGVNAYLSSRSTASLAVEYTVLGLQVDVTRPEPWSPVDSLAWLKAMAWDLRGNYDEELARAATYSSVRDVARVDELFPPYPYERNQPIITPEAATATTAAHATTSGLDLASADLQAAIASATQALAAVPHLVGKGDGVGSNSWVVSGAHTATGSPILANDPHLSISAPGVWAQVSLQCRDVTAACPFDVSGFSFAGLPGVIIGHNGRLAWGLTNLGADVTDFFLERVTDTTYQRDGTQVPLEVRTETIKVNGGADVRLTIRSTVHGPIVSDVLPLDTVASAPVPEDAPFGRYAVALDWTALTPGRTADAIFALDTASDAAGVKSAAALFDVPSQNIVFATTSGDIGYQAPGRIPIRATVPGVVPSDGTWPRPGWDSAYDWKGYVPAADMPAELNPPDGIIVAANQAVTPAGTGPFLTSDWDYGYRAQRIRTLLTESIAAGTKITTAQTSAMQLDDLNPYAQMLVPALLKISLPTAFDADGQKLLRTWDMRSGTDSAAAMYFSAVWAKVLELTFWDEVPDAYRPTGGSRWLEVVRGLLERPNDPYWDDHSTVGVVEGRDEILARALISARLELTASLGKDPKDWSWGLLHTAAPQHPVLGGPSVPGLIRRLVNPTPLAVPGSGSIVDATAWDAASGSFTVTSAPSMRMVVDLKDLDRSTWVTLTGTSGHPGSVHYTDQFQAWADGRTFPWPFTPAAQTAAADQQLTLRPAS
ncbi:penicillin acylase family protein [Cellulomonas sp. P24]|uniref:penicillin acylase family protein n=1 Tax=Cellulomonas sp. P24 TaxID=2885206 RepID=UPI00216B30AD|nr:penicillin acylase family protein [Cellulomonas sp. P24]MCR6493715.1 penicillin acylase family protein [Cellulomonas sp. P24]